ncbi:MAG: alpha/beta fold hydrolase [Candidatus Aminicenantes bacterium]|nr:MAG: alpha/beta fold hydrolase [Candidatus Aminicenantes bacterium]
MTKKIRAISMVICMTIIISNAVHAVEKNEAINKEFTVKSGGEDLYIKVQGKNINNPVLLFLHGGPGDHMGLLYFQAYAGPELEKHFVVGYLHQRGVCRSSSVPASSLTIEHYLKDVDYVVAFLKEKFNKDKIFLLGHSFGGTLGNMYLLKHEDNIEKFISAGSAFSTISIDENGYKTVLQLAKKANNQRAVERLKSLGLPPHETFQEGMIWRMLGMNIVERMNEGILKNLHMSKVMSVTGIARIEPEWQRKSMAVGNAMWSELNTIDIEEKVKNISIPVLIIAGAKDIFVPFKLMKKGYENYGGEK